MSHACMLRMQWLQLLDVDMVRASEQKLELVRLACPIYHLLDVLPY